MREREKEGGRRGQREGRGTCFLEKTEMIKEKHVTKGHIVQYFFIVCVCVCVCVCKGLAVSELSTWPFHRDISYPTSQGGRMALYQLLGMSMPTIHSEIRKVLQMGLQTW